MDESTSFVDYYELLGVAVDAEVSEIRGAFIRLAREHHPDVGGSTETMQQISAAYRTLISETSRRAYDMLHNFHTGRSETEYREHGSPSGFSQADDLTDDEIDDFIDEIFREYHAQSQPKKGLLYKFRSLF